MTVTSGALYLRARSGSVWSTSSLQVNGLTFISTPPAAPSSASHGHSIKNGSVSVPLSVTTVSGATSYKWYSSGGALITTTTLPSYTPTVSATTTYHVASVISFCESTSRTPVTANVYIEPMISATNEGRISAGNPVLLSVPNFVYDQFEWLRGDNTVIGTGATSSVSVEGRYRVRVRKATSPWFTSTSEVQVWEGLNGQNMNYIVTNAIQVPNITQLSQVKELPVESKTQLVQYFDGLGRLLQTVVTQNSPQLGDVVQPIAYDEFGRETFKYLPYVSGNTGLYKTTFLEQHEPGYSSSEQNTFYNGSGRIAQGGGKPFSEIRFEKSPLNRVLAQGATGPAWQPDRSDAYGSKDRTVKFAYEINGVEEVLLWTYTYPSGSNASGGISARLGSGLVYYDQNQLYKRRTKDEQHHEVIEYTDKEGKVVLKRVQAPDSAWADTYYIYDDFGNLVVVLPPEATKTLLQN